MSKPIVVYTDGACSGNPGPGGYGVVIEDADGIREYAGHAKQTTNQRMELKAAVVGLANTPEGSEVVLHSDSAYLIRAWREGWLARWQKNGWRNSKREPVANQDLWQSLLQLASTRQVTWKKVAGHAGDERNERCDYLARAASKNETAKATVERKPYLLVLNKGENTAMYMDVAQRRIVKTLPVDKNPHEVVVSPDGKFAYITCPGSNTLLILDNQAMSIAQRVSHPDFDLPHGLALTRDGKQLLVASTGSGQLLVFDLPAWEARQMITTGQKMACRLALTPDERHAYIANAASNTLTCFDMEKGEIDSHIPVGQGPQGVAVHPDGAHIYVVHQGDNDLYVLDAIDYRLLCRLCLGSLPVRLTISPDGKHAFVANRESGDLSIIDCERAAEIKRIRVGIWPGGIVFDEAGQFAYVANNKTNDISIIDVASLQEVERINVGIHPDGIAFFNNQIVKGEGE